MMRERTQQSGPAASTVALVTCTTWFEYGGDRYGEQSFLLDTATPEYGAVLESLRSAQRSNPGFHALIRQKASRVGRTRRHVTHQLVEP